jgi:carboxypeptidase Q
MRRPALSIVTLSLAAVVAATPAAPRLAESIVKEQRTMQFVRELTAMGPRLTGSAGLEHAASWAAGQLRAAGITDAAVETFTIPDAWERERASGRIVAPVERALHVAALGWTPSTPDGGVTGDLVALDDPAPDRVAASPARYRARIVLLPDDEAGGATDAVARRRRALDAALRDAGALAILSPDPDAGADASSADAGRRDAGNELSARDRVAGARLGALPAAQIGAGDARTIRRLLERGPVRIALELQNRVTVGGATAPNVVGEIRGGDRAAEWVVVGAHLDSWDVGPAAQDNATGVATVLDAARAIAALGARPRRSIRFALWGGEEQGQLGSTAYARAHAAELDNCVAALNSDAGTGRLIGWTAPNRPDVVAAVRPLVRPLRDIARVEFDTSSRYAFQSDGAPFVRAGIPMLDVNADDSRYEEIHHKTADTIERVDARQLTVAAAMVAATAFAIADAPERIAPRAGRTMGRR